MKTHIALAKLGHWNAHPLQSLSVKDVQTAATVHQYLGQTSASDHGVDYQSLPPGVATRAGWSDWSNVMAV